MKQLTIYRGSATDRLVRSAALSIALLVVLIIPLISNPYRNLQWTLVAVFVVVTLGMNLLIGFTGQISLGHSAFFAIGAYVTAKLAQSEQLGFLSSVLLSAAAAFVAGLLFGLPALRLKGLYLALVTIALAVVTPGLIKRFDGITGGVQGLSVPGLEPPAWTGLAADQWVYYMAFAVAGVGAALARNLSRGFTGHAMIAVRDNELAATTLGVDVARVKVKTFAVSSGLAGAAGALYAYAVGFVAPDAFTLLLAVSFLSAAVVGGVSTIAGAAVGAAFVQFVPVYASAVNPSLAGLLYGVALVSVIIVAPLGVVGSLRRAGAHVVRIRSPRPSSACEEAPLRRV